MKQLVTVILLIACVHALDMAGCRLASGSGIEKVKDVVADGLEDFNAFINDSLVPAISRRNNKAELAEKFVTARLHYKKIEWAAKYFMPTTSRYVNGPPLPEIENEENQIFEPEGLQVIETLIYTEDSVHYTELLRQAKMLAARSLNYKNYWKAIEVDSSQVTEAIKLQVFRTVTLGITGFDAPLAKSSLDEAAASLLSVKNITYILYRDNNLDSSFARAITFAHEAGFDEFDRLLFIKEYCNPITKRLVQLQQEHHVAFVNNTRLLRASAATLFDENVFDVNAYATDSTYFMTLAKIELGQKLFNDPLLSNNGNASCAGCHNPSKGFTDGLVKNISLTKQLLPRNTPTLLNAALQPWQFYDMRITNLENQSRDVIENKEEMHGNLAAAVKKLQNDNTYRELFHNAFDNTRPMEEWHVQNALASYVRSLSLLNSRFDQYMRNKEGIVLSVEEKQGFNLFMGKAKCGTCHFAPLFNGTVPPAFIKMESEVLGVPADKSGTRLDKDPGRYAMHSLMPYLNAFKTTTVRNVALTAPYMHNGVFSTLEEVIDFYNKGGGVGLGLDVPNQTLPPDTLGLSMAEKQSLIAFLKTLTDSYKSQ